MTPNHTTDVPFAVPSDRTAEKDESPRIVWGQQLLDAPVALDLVTDLSRPLAPSGRRGRHSFTLAPELVIAIDELSRAAEVTPLVTLLAGYSALLARYTGGEHFSLGLPVADKQGPLPEGPSDHGVAYLLFGADLSGEPSLRALLTRTSSLLAAARARGAIPAEQIAAALNPQRDEATPSFFQAIFAYVGDLADGLEPAQWPAGGVLDTAPCDLSLVFQMERGQLVGTFGYDADLFEHASVERLAEHLLTLLAAALAAPERSVLAVSFVSVAERERMAAWNQTETPLPFACIHQLFAAQAARTPEAPALLFADGQLSYAELDARANQLAHYLRLYGVGPERIVGVSMARGPELIIALLAILKAGGAYLPLDPIYPVARLADMVEDAKPVALITDGSLPDGVGAAQEELAPLRIIDLNEDAERIRVQPSTAPAERAELNTLAYVIYTSGSTGKPKGVLIEHRSAANYLLGSGMLYEMTPADRGLHFSSVSFDASVDEIFVPLVVGAALVVTAGFSPPDFAELHDLVVRHGITLLSFSTAYWQAWISELSEGRALPPSLRLVIIGGEAASGERYNLWRSLAPTTVRLFNGYGPTETTVGSTWYIPSPHLDEPPGPMAIGRPLPNERAYLLDRHQRPVPIGVQGELYIGGEGLARGYYNRPELTAERFVFVAGIEGPEPVRLYRTGDLARWRADGQLQFYGRADQQVKVRGYRIEPAEIEATLRSHPAVQAAAVITRPNQAGELSLVGYVVLKDPVETRSLRVFLDERLPHYMIPSALMVLEALPLTPSGKIDRRALPEPEYAEAPPITDDERERTHVEQVLSTIWEELLGQRAISLHSNFFELGGHSLLAMRMLGRVTSELGARLPVSIMIHHATIATLAEAITAEDKESAWSVLVPIQPEGERPPLFCVHGITGDVLWFHELGRCMAPDQPVYGLQARGLAPGEPYATSIEQMAAWYIEAMRSVQPRGPYFISGASFGGVVALEIARQLEAAGDTLGLVAILDFDPYQSDAGRPSRLKRIINSIRYLPQRLGDELRSMTPSQRKVWALWRLRYRLKRTVSLLLGGVSLPPEADDNVPYSAELPVHRRELLIANAVAFERYRPRPFGGRLTLFATESWYTFEAATTSKSGWADLAGGGVAIERVPGSHETMFQQPHVAELANRLRKLIDASPAAEDEVAAEAA